MNIQTYKQGEIDVLRPAGRIDSNTSTVFDRAVNELFDGGARRLVIDFSQIDYVSSAGLRSTLLAGKRMRAVSEGKLALCSLAPAVREIFDISGFTSIFTLCADLESALAACAV